MKRLLVIALTVILAAGYALAGTYEGDYGVGSAANGIGYSRHNLGGFGSYVRTESTFEICVFCHTPHHSNTGTSPLWNRSVAASSTYTAYGTTIAGTNNQSIGLGSPSLACLSCHDGATTFDNIANSPGKGGVNLGGATLGWQFLRGQTPVPNKMVSESLVIGANLTNDHPVNVLFRGGEVASLRSPDTIISQINLSAEIAFTTENVTKNLWSIKGFISDTASIGDLLRDGRVECPSCHDPHFNNKSWTEQLPTFNDVDDMDSLFLRRVGGNTGSGVCRTCHQK